MDASVTFVGCATTILRLGPFTLLTDPNFMHAGQRAYLGKGLFSKRLTEPAMQPQGLPALDAMLIHLGGTRIVGVLVTMDGAQGVDMVDLIRPVQTVPIHYDDYTVFRSPLSDFVERFSRRGSPSQLRVVARGQTVDLRSALGGRQTA